MKWASRWDVYLEMADTQIHWFSIINSVVVVFFLSGIITMIIIRTLRRDIAKVLFRAANGSFVRMVVNADP